MSTPITDILDKLDKITNSYTFNGYAALMSSVHTALTLSVTAYIAFVGWMAIQGWGQLSMGETVKHVLKIAVAYTLATQWSFFAKYIYDVFTNGPNELSAVLMHAVGGGSSDSANSALQTSFNKGITIGQHVWDLHGVSVCVAAVLIWAMNFLVTGVALLEMTVAKCGLAVTLVFAPVFAMFLLWNSTKGFFDRWVSVALGFALVPLFLTAVLLMVNQLMQMGLDSISSSTTTGTGTFSCIGTFVLASIASFALLLRAASIAANIAGGFSVSSLGTAMSSARLADKASGFKAARGAATDSLSAAAGYVGGAAANKIKRKWHQFRN